MLILEEIIDSFSLWEASGKVPHTSTKVPKFDQLIERRYREGTGKVPGGYREGTGKVPRYPDYLNELSVVYK